MPQEMMIRTISFDEMPYDESLLLAIEMDGVLTASYPQLSSMYLALYGAIKKDMEAGNVLVKARHEILREMEDLLEQARKLDLAKDDPILAAGLEALDMEEQTLKVWIGLIENSIEQIRELWRIFKDHGQITAQIKANCAVRELIEGQKSLTCGIRKIEVHRRQLLR